MNRGFLTDIKHATENKKIILFIIGLLGCAYILNPFFELKLLLLVTIITLCYQALPEKLIIKPQIQLLFIVFIAIN